jgi:hypothetical protein
MYGVITSKIGGLKTTEEFAFLPSRIQKIPFEYSKRARGLRAGSKP